MFSWLSYAIHNDGLKNIFEVFFIVKPTAGRNVFECFLILRPAADKYILSAKLLSLPIKSAPFGRANSLPHFKKKAYHIYEFEYIFEKKPVIFNIYEFKFI